jgi:hypothetical protein
MAAKSADRSGAHAAHLRYATGQVIGMALHAGRSRGNGSSAMPGNPLRRMLAVAVHQRSIIVTFAASGQTGNQRHKKNNSNY